LAELHTEWDEHSERQNGFEKKIEEQGLGHELVRGPRWPKWLIKAVAAVFETIALIDCLARWLGV
jgi:hypothetical protein